MSCEEFIQKVNKDQTQKVSWEETFYPQIKTITSHVMTRMADVFEPSPGSFELFGFDFVIDESMKCWLLEANMSPACAERKSQPWLQEMVEDMTDGLLNIVEHKVLKNMAGTKIPYNGYINEKIQQVKDKNFKADIKNWELLNFEFDKKVKLENNFDNTTSNNLEIYGKQANLKFEKKMDKGYKRH